MLFSLVIHLSTAASKSVTYLCTTKPPCREVDAAVAGAFKTPTQRQEFKICPLTRAG